MDKKDKKNLVILLLLSAISFFSVSWIREADLMEQRNFITAREMIFNKEYIVTTLNGNLRFEKPPFPTWLTMIVMKISNNFSDECILRIPSVLTGILLVFLVYYFIKDFTKSRSKGFFSSFVTLSTFMIIKISNENTWDIYTYVFSFASILTFYKGIKNCKLKNFILTSIFLALSIMSKGPVGIYGLFLPFILAYILTFGIREFKTSWKNILLMILLTTLLSLIWPIMMYLKYPEYFLQVMNKEEQTWSTKHKQGIFFYLDYFVYTGVWIFFAVITWIKKIKNKSLKNNNLQKFLILWNLIVIIFLSIIQMKKKRYGIPIYIVSSLNIGILCSYYYKKTWNKLKSWERKFFYLQSGLLIFISLGVIVIFLWGSLVRKNISLLYSVSSVTIYILIILSIFKFIKYHKNKIGKITILSSGILMIWVNINANWVIDKKLIHKEIKNNFITIKTLRKNPPKLDIYAQNYDVGNIWNMGKIIKPLNDLNNLPNKFIVLGDIPESLKNDYLLLKNEVYSEKNGDLINLYYLAKKEK